MSTAIHDSIGAAMLVLVAASCSGNGPRDTARSAKPQATAASPTSAPAAWPRRQLARGESAARPHRRLVRDEELSPLAREALVDPMRSHGDNLESLLWTTLMLDHGSTAKIAGWIAEEPKLSRPRGVPDTLNAEFPPEFFTLQDELYRNAADLARAATREDDAAVADAFSRLAGTCIRCHSTYLDMPRSR